MVYVSVLLAHEKVAAILWEWYVVDDEHTGIGMLALHRQQMT